MSNDSSWNPMATDTAINPSLGFPYEGVGLPYLPKSYLVPKPPNYPTDNLYFYLTTIVNNETSHVTQKDHFGSLETSVRSNDIIEAEWYENNGRNISVSALTVYCLVCRGVMDTKEEAWQSCTTNATNMQTAINQYDDVPYGETNVTVPEPKGNATADGMMVCTVALRLTTTMKFGLGDDPMVLSQLFLAQNKARNDSSYTDSAYNPYFYNWRHSRGTPSRPSQVLTPSASASATPSPTSVCASGKFGSNCDYWADWNDGKKAAVFIGSIIGAFIVLGVVWRIFFRKRYNERRGKPKAGLDERDQHVQGAHGADVVPSRTQQAPWRSGAAGGTSDPDPPPAYHEVVRDEERGLAQPPVYDPARG